MSATIRGVLRFMVLLALAVLAGLLIALPRMVSRSPDPPRLTWVATAHQHGPVGYRDPAGAISPDGRWIAYTEGRFLRVRPVEGGPAAELPAGRAQIRHLAWESDSRRIVTDGPAAGAWARYDRVRGTRQELAEPPSIPEAACVQVRDGRPRITLPCAGAAVAIRPDIPPHGPVALSPDGAMLYFSAPNDQGTVDLWSAPSAGGAAQRLTSFSTDSYAPTLAADGSVLFKVQSYRTVVARAPADGGATELLASFRSETPSWHPDGDALGITYGSWRRLVDDAKYPDIAQDAGVIRVRPGQPATAVAQVVDDSGSEDQSLCWSPNSRWIAYHSHKEESDDVWLRPADGGAPGRRISFLGRGAETGWPRWSPDGRWVVFNAAAAAGAGSVLYLIGVDEATGAVTSAAQPVAVRGVSGEFGHAEWLGGSDALAVSIKEAPGRHVIAIVTRVGGEARIVHHYASEHDFAGLAASPDGHHVAFVAPAADGFFQVFRMALSGGLPVQVTRDPSHKTQPAWSPDGRTIAFTVWSYEAQFWAMRP